MNGVRIDVNSSLSGAHYPGLQLFGMWRVPGSTVKFRAPEWRCAMAKEELLML